MKKLSLALFLVLFGVSYMVAQRTVSGMITDKSSEPLIGASVLVKGTGVGTVTDIDGKYKIDVPAGSNALVFSYTGFADQEITLGASNVVDVTLEEGVVLGEVVVTALGIEKEASALGYSVDQIGAEELVKARETNIVNALQGKVTGVSINNTSGNIGGSSKITIRGLTSLSGANNPLWVVDGVPINNDQYVAGNDRISGNRDFGNGASVVNPDDVETMSILKGAAATALYGSRAAAGAIIVTTKRGNAREGRGAKVTINTSYRWDDLYIIPDYQQDYAQGSLFKYDSSAVGFDWGPRNIGQTVNSLPITGETGPLTRQDDNSIKDFFSTGTTAINNFSISDGDERMDYRLSMTALNQEGIVPGSSLDRYTFSLNAGIKHSDKLKSRFGVQFIKSNTEGTAAAGANDPNIIGVSSFSSTLDQNVFKPWIDDAGNQINQPSPTANNPFWIRHENKNSRDDTRVISNVSLTYTPIERLDITAILGYDFDQDNRFFSNRKGTAQRLQGNFEVDDINSTQLNTDITANYNFDINDDLSLNVLGGFNYNKREFTRESLFGSNLLIPELFSPGNVSQTVPNRDYTERAFFGLYTSIDLSFRNYLTLSVTGRNDWTSTLPKDNRSYFYPSVSTAFVFTEAFGIDDRILSYGKFRASYAEVGNDTNPYQLDFNFLPISEANGQYGLDVNFPFDSRLAFSKSSVVPPANLLPERQKSFEIGAELKFIDYRFGLDIAYFRTENINQILALPIPQSTGFSFLRTNVGQVNTDGIEISLDATVIKKKNFRWNTLVNFTKNQTKVKELADGVDRVLIASAFNSVQVVAVEGGTFELLAIPFLRDSTTGRPIINPNDGTRLAGEARSFGSVLPDFNMGFVNSFGIGPVNVSFTIDWRKGGVMKSSSVEDLQTGGLVSETTQNREGTFIDTDGVLLNADGTVRDNDIPLASAERFWNSLDDNSIGEPFIFGADYVKLREIAINYSLPKSVLSNLGNGFISQLQVGVEARNVALLYSKVPHIDPESGLFGSGSDGFGVERNSIPTTRSIGVNLKLVF